MKRKLLVLVLLMVSMVSFAQYATYDEFMKVARLTKNSEVSKYITPKGWKYFKSWRDGEITGTPWEDVFYTKNCTVNDDGEPRNTGTGWSVFEVSKYVKSGKTEHLTYMFGNYSVYSKFLSAAKSNGFRYDDEYNGDEYQAVSYRRNRECMTFYEYRNYYSVDYNPYYY